MGLAGFFSKIPRVQANSLKSKKYLYEKEKGKFGDAKKHRQTTLLFLSACMELGLGFLSTGKTCEFYKKPVIKILAGNRENVKHRQKVLEVGFACTCRFCRLKRVLRGTGKTLETPKKPVWRSL